MTWLLSRKIIFHLITNSASLNPLGHFEVAHCKVEPASLKKRLPLVLCLPFQRDLVLQEVYHLCKTKLCIWHWTSMLQSLRTFLWFPLTRLPTHLLISAGGNLVFLVLQRGKIKSAFERSIVGKLTRLALKCFVPFSLKMRACSSFCSASSWTTLDHEEIQMKVYLDVCFWFKRQELTCQLSLAFSNLTNVNS